MKIIRIYLERGTTESRYEREIGHGYQMTGAAVSTSANAKKKTKPKNPQKTPKPQRLGSTVTIPYFRK